MSDKPVSRVEVFLEEAKRALEEKDFAGFMLNIGKAELLAENNTDEVAKVSFLKSKGLFKFNQHKRALNNISEALEYNLGTEEVFHLRRYQGIILGYLGEFEKAKESFRYILDTLDNTEYTVRTYLNLAWINLISYRSKKEISILDEAKEYLDLANTYFENLPDRFKWKICNNYSVYYFYKNDYDEAIHILEKAMNYCEEKEYPWIYTNLADIYLQFEGIDVTDKIKEYTEKAEVIATKYENDFLIGKAFYIQAMSQLKADEFFRCLDTLYVSFEYFKKAENYPHAFDCLVKMNEIISDYKLDRLKSLKDSLNKEFKDTSYYNIL